MARRDAQRHAYNALLGIEVGGDQVDGVGDVSLISAASATPRADQLRSPARILRFLRGGRIADGPAFFHVRHRDGGSRSTAFAQGDPVLAPTIAVTTEDTVAALQRLVDQADVLDVDPTRLVVADYSAGGVLTEIVSYLPDQAAFALASAALAAFSMSGALDPSVQIVSPGDPALLMTHDDLGAKVPIDGAHAISDRAIAAALSLELHVLVRKGHANIVVSFSDEVAPGETNFARFVASAKTHVAPPAGVPVIAAPGSVAFGLELAALGAARLRTRRSAAAARTARS